jgi:putative FmdB family regulatory protein
MPIYEYVCSACGRETEIMHKISDPTPRKCPKCGKLKLSKQMSATGFRLGGGGWYETDFKSSGKKNLAGDKAPASDAAACAPTGCDKPGCGAKAETKKEAKKEAPKAAKAA